MLGSCIAIFVLALLVEVTKHGRHLLITSKITGHKKKKNTNTPTTYAINKGCNDTEMDVTANNHCGVTTNNHCGVTTNNHCDVTANNHCDVTANNLSGLTANNHCDVKVGNNSDVIVGIPSDVTVLQMEDDVAQHEGKFR
jgi:hypothetical protein